jgi:probable rRNA maturation factor
MDERSRSEAEVEVEVNVQVAPRFAGIISEERLRDVGEAVLRREGVVAQASLVVTDDEGIQELNRDFRGIDAATDVLAFGAREEAGAFVSAPEAGAYLGDVIVSYPRAEAQAEEQGHSVEEELHLLVVHGLLHLLGYDHVEEEEKSVMWGRQDEILGNL